MQEAKGPERWRHHSVSACAHVAFPVLAERFFRWTHAAGSEGTASSPEPPRAPLLDLALARAGMPFGAFVSVRCANPPMVLASRDIWALPRHGIFSEPGADRIPGPVAMLRLCLRSILDAHPNLLRHPGAVLEFNIMHHVKDDCPSLSELGQSGGRRRPAGSASFQDPVVAVTLPSRSRTDSRSTCGEEQDRGEESSSDGADTLPFPLDMEWDSEAIELGEPDLSPSPGRTPSPEEAWQCGGGTGSGTGTGTGSSGDEWNSWSNAERSDGVASDPERSEGVCAAMASRVTPSGDCPSLSELGQSGGRRRPAGSASFHLPPPPSLRGWAVPRPRDSGSIGDPRSSSGAEALRASELQRPPADRKRGYLVCSTLGERAIFMPHSVATLHESEDHILAALGGRIRGPPVATVSFSVQRLTASVFEVVRLLWRTSIGRCLRCQLEEFVRVRWAGNLPAANVSMLHGTPMKMTTSFDPSDLVRNARAVTRWFALLRHVRQERGGGLASAIPAKPAGDLASAAGAKPARREGGGIDDRQPESLVADFAEAFLPVSALQKLSGRALSHAAALLLGCGVEAPFSDAWARSAAACVGVVLVGSRLPMHVAIEMVAALSEASLAVPRPAMEEIGNLPPASLDTPSLMAATALLRATGGRHAWRSLVAVLARWCDEAMCGPTSRPRPFAMFGTDELASILLALSYVPRAELVPVLRTAWLEVLGECCRRWLVGMPFLVARNLQTRAQINDTLALALSTMM
jgi:hypothetical protein